MEWIDIHTHLEMLKTEPDVTLSEAAKNNVTRMITIGCHPKDNAKILEIARKYFPRVACTLGVHPHEALHWDANAEAFIRKNITEPCVVAIGEIGLDYFYKHSPIDLQKEVFRKQMDLAAELKMPIQIHTRDADEDTIEILKEFSGRVKGVIHCFTGTQRLADEALALGYNISFSGIVTFKNADPLRSVAKSVPLDRLHVETDSPFLTPVPLRGKTENSPALVIHTGRLIAELKGVSEKELAALTTANTLKMFPKLS